MSCAILNLINNFSVTSLLHLAIFVTSIRTSLARLALSLEWAGIPSSLCIAVVIALGIYLYLYVSRQMGPLYEDQLEEEMNMLDEMEINPDLTIHPLPLVMLWESGIQSWAAAEREDSLVKSVVPSQQARRPLV